MKYPLTHTNWDKKEISAMNKVIKSGMFTMGKNVLNFEKNFSKYLTKKYSVMVNSGSSANLVGLSSLFFKKNKPLKRGDEVIVTAVSWSTTYSPLQQLGLKLKLVDINLKTFNVDEDLLIKAISKKTKLIVLVNLLGIPCNLKKIKSVCDKKGIYLFEDNCESMGAKISGKLAGSFGDLSSHSFFFSHHMCTMEGGMISTDNYELYCIIKSLRAHGWSRDLPKNNPLIKLKKNDFYEQYKFILPGYNVRPGELHGAIGNIQLKKINRFINIRRKNLLLFNKLIGNNQKVIIPKTDYFSSSFAFPIIVKNLTKTKKIELFKNLKRAKIDFRLVTGGCFTKHDYQKYFDYKIYKNLKNSNFLHNNGFFVGNASKDLSSGIKSLAKILEKTL
jgi:CDP-6-deoxy-D-xylo-4-hexulose-3-dehydrase